MADQITLQDVSKMKVAELKKVLKDKNLPITGSKSELQERLTLSLTEDKQTAEPETNDEEVNENKNTNTTETEVQGSQLSPQVKEEKVEKEDQPTVPASEAPLQKITAPKPISTTLSEEERIKKRTERFGVVNEDAKKQARAERFGVSAVKSGSEGGAVSADILKKRAERFGQVVSSSLSKENEAAKLQKRKERFGEVTSSANNTPAKFAKITFNSDSAEDQKKKTRAERFGLT